MSKIKKILVGVDGSATSYRAVEMALDLASSLNAKVTALHVVPLLSVDYMALGLGSNASPEDIDKKVLHEVRIMAYSKNVKVETIILKGRPSEVITSVAEGENYDLIVLGNTGVGGAYRRIMGSVVAEVINTTKKPVLLVK
ncbi:MAG: universal stress protein [Candidatus Nezhaarchaeales archaeon]